MWSDAKGTLKDWPSIIVGKRNNFHEQHAKLLHHLSRDLSIKTQ